MALKAAQTEAEKNEAIDEQLNDLEKQIDRLKSMYEQYFLGIQKTAPAYIHNEVDRKIRDITQLNIRQTRLRYRFVTLQQKFGSYSAYWKRTLREIESGKYIRNLSKIGRNAIKTGAEIPEEILNAMPKRMREQVVKDRAAAIAQAKRRGKLDDGAGEGEFALEDATSEDAMLEIGEDFAAVIREPTELRRSLKPAPNTAHKLEENDDFDLDAFFAQVQSEPEPPKPASRAKAPTAPPAPPGVARIQSKAKEATIVGAPRPSQVMRAEPPPPPPPKPTTQPRVAAQPDPRASNPALRPSQPVIQETQALPVRVSQPVISGPAQVTRPSSPAIPPPRNTPPMGIPAIPRSAHTQPGVAPPRPPTAGPNAVTQPMPQVPANAPPTLTQPMAKVATRQSSQGIKPLTIQPGASAAQPPRTVENAPSSGTFKPPPAAPLRPPPGMSDADVNALHANYVKAKQMVGEDPGNNSRDKLLRTINAQAPKIMEQYKVGSVDFSVAVKDNQVIIRAKPKSDKK